MSTQPTLSSFTSSNPTTDPDPDAAIKTRIKTHMTADHSSSLSLYLQYYSKIPAKYTTSPVMDDITLDYMTITSSFGRTLIPFTPPMQSYSEARARLASMHVDSLHGLGYSDITVSTWTPPQGFHLILFITCAIIFVSFRTRLSFISPSDGGSRFWYAFWSASGNLPQLARLNYVIQPYLLAFMIVVHGGEAGWLAWSRLRKHQVKTFGVVWFTWVVDCFIEGFGCFERFDQIVREKEEAKKVQKH